MLSRFGQREEWLYGVGGYRYYGLEDVARLPEGVREASENEVAAADESYAELVPDDQILMDRFEARYLERPGDFASP